MSMPSNRERSWIAERILVLSPLGGDAEMTLALLRQAGLTAERCSDLTELIVELEHGAGAAVISQEAVLTADFRPLAAWTGAQPPWSDLPLIVLTDRGASPERNPGAFGLMQTLGNVTLLERPFHPASFVSIAESALRSRRRQNQARAQLAELERREQALLDSEKHFVTLANNIPVLIWTAQADGRIFWYNSRWYEYTGTTPEQIEEGGWQSVHDPARLPAVLETWQASIRDGQYFEIEFPLRGADGVLREFQTRVVPVRDESGQVVRWFGTSVDISAERAAEAEARSSEERLRNLNEMLEQQVTERTAQLRRNEARLRAIFETSYQLQALLAIDGTLLDTNATSLAVIGARLDDVLGKPFWETPWFSATPGMSELVRASVAVAASGESIRQEVAVNIPSGLRSFDFSIRPIRDDQGQVVAILPEAADITERRQAEEALRQSQKMEAIGQLTGGIAHDFNNMLQSIASGVELMRRRILQGRADEAERYVEAARQSIDRAAALTHRLLAFSRRQVLAPKCVELDALIRGMVGLIRQTVGPEIAVELHLLDGAWPVRCDPNQLENALLNLAINARDAMSPAGGKLRLTTGHVFLGEPELIGWSQALPGDYVSVSVTDTGTGMAPDVLERAFEPFFTTKTLGQGTGLGLSQVFGFVSQSNGVVRLETEIGRGTTAQLYLPRFREPRPAGQTTAEPARSDPEILMAATVLLVEDEADIRALVAEALGDLGCTVIEAEDGPAGLKIMRDLLAASRGGVDLLVADIGLPGGVNGRQLADAARELLPGLPVLLITGYAGDAVGPDAQLPAGMTLLTKPFSLAALTARVEAILLDVGAGDVPRNS